MDKDLLGNGQHKRDPRDLRSERNDCSETLGLKVERDNSSRLRDGDLLRKVRMIVEEARRLDESLPTDEKILGALESHNLSDVKRLYAPLKETIDTIVRRNVPLIMFLMKDLPVPLGHDRELIHEGIEALIHAIFLFDEKKGTQFSTYAGYWIRHHLHRHLDYLGDSALRFVSEDRELEAVAEPVHSKVELQSDLSSALARLSDKEREVVYLRLIEDKTFQEIGAKFGFSRQRAQQVYVRALRKMKRFLEVK